MMSHNNGPPRIYIRVNTLRTSKDALEELMNDLGIHFESFPFPRETLRIDTPPQEIPLPLEHYYAQDFSTQVIPYLLSPEKGTFVYDAAVAPGGKASHVYQILEGDTLLLGVDRLRSRLRMTRSVFQRLGVENYFLIQGDSAYLPLRKAPDFVLVDVPCSGLGTLRRKAELRWRMSEERISYLSELQRDMLEGVAQNMGVGGVIVYATCTTEPEENEVQVHNFLRKHREFVLENPLSFVPEKMTKNGFLWVDGIEWDSDFSFAARMRRVR